MNTFRYLTLISSAMLVAFASSCVKHKPPPSDDILYSNNYSASNIKTNYSSPQSGQILTLNEATRIALANNPNIQIADLKVISASAQYYSSLLAYTPSVTAGKQISQPSANIATSMTLWNGLTNQINVLSAKAQTISAEEMSLNTRRLLIEQVALVYNTILADKANITIQRNNLDFYQEQLQKLQIKPKASPSDISDALQFKIKIDMAHSDAIKSIENFNNDKCALAVLMGLPTAKLPANTLFPEIETLKEPQKDLSVDQYLDMAINKRPDLQASKENLKSANYDLYSSYGQLSPAINATSQLNKNQQNSNAINATQNLNPATAITNIRSSQAQKDSADENLAATYTQVATDVRTSYNQLSSSVASEKILQDQTDIGMQSRNLVTQEYSEGKVGIDRVIQSQNDLVRAETQYMKSAIDIKINQAKLDAAVGIGME